MRATEHFGKTNVAAGTYLVQPDGNGAPYIFGGRYQFQFNGTGTGTVDVQTLSADGATWVAAMTQITATSGLLTFDMPPGQARVVIATFTANSFNLTRVPTSE